MTGLPAGWGDPMFGGMESRIAGIVYGIPAVKGLEFGAGFQVADMTGSENNDAFVIAQGKIQTTTNHSGGILGGITNAMPLTFRGVPKKIRMERARKYLKLVGLEKQMDHMANEMSGGQQQRVGIARALVVDPRIIFADEPTGNLDSKTTMDVLRLMRRIVRERNQTLIMVTHDTHLAGFADKQIHIVDGKILKIEEQYHDDEEEI